MFFFQTRSVNEPVSNMLPPRKERALINVQGHLWSSVLGVFVRFAQGWELGGGELVLPFRPQRRLHCNSPHLWPRGLINDKYNSEQEYPNTQIQIGDKHLFPSYTISLEALHSFTDSEKKLRCSHLIIEKTSSWFPNIPFANSTLGPSPVVTLWRSPIFVFGRVWMLLLSFREVCRVLAGFIPSRVWALFVLGVPWLLALHLLHRKLCRG